MTVDNIPEDGIRAALGAYGVEPDSVSYLTSGAYCVVYRVDARGKKYVARLRSEAAAPTEVVFAAHWTQAVSSEVPVPVSLLPLRDVPTIDGRCLDLAPFVPHEHTNGGEVGPDAWISVARMLGAMHRLGMPLTEDAPRGLPYGNYPHERLVRSYLSRAKLGVPQEHRGSLTTAEDLLLKAIDVVGSREGDLPVGVVHGDMHFWNVLYADGMPVGIIDFDFLQRGFLIFDVAYACLWLYPWERDRGDAWANISAKYIGAYEEARQWPLSVGEKACLSWCQVWLSVFFFLSKAQRTSEDIEKAVVDDLRPAEALASTLQLL